MAWTPKLDSVESAERFLSERWDPLRLYLLKSHARMACDGVKYARERMESAKQGERVARKIFEVAAVAIEAKAEPAVIEPLLKAAILQRAQALILGLKLREFDEESKLWKEKLGITVNRPLTDAQKDGWGDLALAFKHASVDVPPKLGFIAWIDDCEAWARMNRRMSPLEVGALAIAVGLDDPTLGKSESELRQQEASRISAWRDLRRRLANEGARVWEVTTAFRAQLLESIFRLYDGKVEEFAAKGHSRFELLCGVDAAVGEDVERFADEVRRGVDQRKLIEGESEGKVVTGGA